MTAEQSFDFWYEVEEAIDVYADEFMKLQEMEADTAEVGFQIIEAVLFRRNMRIASKFAVKAERPVAALMPRRARYCR